MRPKTILFAGPLFGGEKLKYAGAGQWGLRQPYTADFGSHSGFEVAIVIPYWPAPHSRTPSMINSYAVSNRKN